MLHWAAAPAPARQPVQITSMLAQGCRVWLAKATPVTSRASLARLLPPGIPVLINSNNKLGTIMSSKRFKKEIRPMDKASDALLALKPVTFRYKEEIDPTGTTQFGLVAEQVEKVSPDLVVRDAEGKPYSVRYDQVNAVLLNEFLKTHSKMEEQEVTIAHLKQELQATATHQQKQIKALTTGLQKVSAELETTKPAPQTVLNNH